jgi:hypothetical protein
MIWFWTHVLKTEKCWLWIGCRLPSGYGKLRRKGKDWLAHRFIYTNLVGPIPEGLTIDHLCRVRNCVNPEHMELVTQGENTLRGESVSGLAARKTHCPQGHEYSGDNLILQKNGHRKCRFCVQVYDRKRRPSNKKKKESLISSSGD